MFEDILNNKELISFLTENHTDLYEYLEKHFKNEGNIIKWLNIPKPMLGDISPARLLERAPDQVYDYIFKSKTGDFS